MSLDPDILELSFDLVAPDGDRLMDEFYARLFVAAPVVRALFPHDLARQKRKLLEALVLLRGSPAHARCHRAGAAQLGARHARYGARAEHYPVVGAALIASMRAVAGTGLARGVRRRLGAGDLGRRLGDAGRRGRGVRRCLSAAGRLP